MTETKTFLSSLYLKKNGWIKKGAQWINSSALITFEKKYDTVTYNGCTWLYYRFPDCVKEVEGGGIKIEPTRVEYTDQVL